MRVPSPSQGKAFLEPHMDHRRSLTVSTMARARRVLLDGKRAVGDWAMERPATSYRVAGNGVGVKFVAGS